MTDWHRLSLGEFSPKISSNWKRNAVESRLDRSITGGGLTEITGLQCSLILKIFFGASCRICPFLSRWRLQIYRDNRVRNGLYINYFPAWFNEAANAIICLHFLCSPLGLREQRGPASSRKRNAAEWWRSVRHFWGSKFALPSQKLALWQWAYRGHASMFYSEVFVLSGCFILAETPDSGAAHAERRRSDQGSSLVFVLFLKFSCLRLFTKAKLTSFQWVSFLFQQVCPKTLSGYVIG